MLGAAYVSDGQSAWDGNIETLRGITGQFSEGLVLGYPKYEAPDETPDIVSEAGGAAVLNSQDGHIRVIRDHGNHGYRMVASSMIFGAVRPAAGESDQPVDLMTRYLSYLSGSSTAVTPIAEAPEAFALMQNYPNPFNPQTVIRYQLKATVRVKLSVYDLTGRLIETLVYQNQPSGSHEVIFDGAGLASGVYLAVLEANGRRMVQRMNLAK